MKSLCVLIIKSNELVELPSCSFAVNITLIDFAWRCAREFAVQTEEQSQENRKKTALDRLDVLLGSSRGFLLLECCGNQWGAPVFPMVKLVGVEQAAS